MVAMLFRRIIGMGTRIYKSIQFVKNKEKIIVPLKVVLGQFYESKLFGPVRQFSLIGIFFLTSPKV